MITKTKIESKIKSYINSILEKEAIDYNDFKALNEYLAKIKADESAKKYEETKKRTQRSMAITVSIDAVQYQ